MTSKKIIDRQIPGLSQAVRFCKRLDVCYIENWLTWQDGQPAQALADNPGWTGGH